MSLVFCQRNALAWLNSIHSSLQCKNGWKKTGFNLSPVSLPTFSLTLNHMYVMQVKHVNTENSFTLTLYVGPYFFTEFPYSASKLNYLFKLILQTFPVHLSRSVSWFTTRGRQTHTPHADFILNPISHHAHWWHPHLSSVTLHGHYLSHSDAAFWAQYC